MARGMDVHIVMIHERREMHGSCAFDRFFYTTPEDLVANGLYNDIAYPLFSSPGEQDVAVSLIYKKMDSLRSNGQMTLSGLANTLTTASGEVMPNLPPMLQRRKSASRFIVDETSPKASRRTSIARLKLSRTGTSRL